MQSQFVCSYEVSRPASADAEFCFQLLESYRLIRQYDMLDVCSLIDCLLNYDWSSSGSYLRYCFGSNDVI